MGDSYEDRDDIRRRRNENGEIFLCSGGGEVISKIIDKDFIKTISEPQKRKTDNE
jgi:hypothetical protein